MASITTPVGVLPVVQRQADDVQPKIEAATALIPAKAWAVVAAADAPHTPLPPDDVVALVVTTGPLRVHAVVGVTGAPLAFGLAAALGDPRYGVRVFVPDDECRELHVTVDTLAYVEAWRHETSDSAVLLHKLRQYPFVWRRVCLHYQEGATPTVPRICDRNDRCIIGLAACKKFLAGLCV